MDPIEFQEVTELREQNATQRRKRLSVATKKKYYHLHYNPEPRPERRDSKLDQLRSNPNRKSDEYYSNNNTRSQSRHDGSDTRWDQRHSSNTDYDHRPERRQQYELERNDVHENNCHHVLHLSRGNNRSRTERRHHHHKVRGIWRQLQTRRPSTAGPNNSAPPG